MIGKPDPLSDEIADLLRHERELEATPVEMRRRVLAKARFSQRLAVLPTRRAVKTSYVVAGAFTVAFGAAAFTAIRSHSPAPSERAPLNTPTLNGAHVNTETLDSAPLNTAKKFASDHPSDTNWADVNQGAGANQEAPMQSEADRAGRSKVREINTKPSKDASDPLARELVLLKRARSAVSAGKQSAALTAIQEHAQQFPNGRLREEREALRVTALWNLGRRAEARRAAARFVEQFPRSVLAAQMAAKAEAQP